MIWLVIEVLVSLVMIALFCIFMDVLTLFVEYAWIAPIIIGVYLIVRLVLKFFGKKKKVKTLPEPKKVPEIKKIDPLAEIRKLIDAALIDGTISERERREIVARGAEFGVTPMEVDAIIRARIDELQA